MPTNRDYYEILGVARESSEDDIKRAYRRIAMKYHPDRNPGDVTSEDRFKEASEAYEVLRDPEKRQIYDRFGHEGLEGTGFSGFRGFEDIFASFGDIFEDFFGFSTRTGRRRQRAQSGASLRYILTLTLEEAARGKETQISLQRHEGCPTCEGSGVRPGTSPAVCPMCDGRGQVSRSQGFFSISTTCAHCYGRGEIISDPCETCHGSGRVRTKGKLDVKVPPGVDTGSRLRLRGEGEPGVKGGPAGDLYVDIQVEPHEVFQREGDDILCQIPISFPQAALGARIEVPTLYGPETLEVPKGTQSGTLFHIKGAGMPRLMGRGKGDQVVQTVVKTPTKLNKRQREILRELAEISDEEVENGRKGFWKR